MTSVNFNNAAVSALRNLQQTNASLDSTQSRISTGLKIGEAKDNAAYWSISTTLQSDNKSLSTVKDALGLGSATVDVAYEGLNKAKEVLDEIKSKLTAATQAGVDKTKINDEVTQLKLQLQSIASSSTFSGENWLNSDAGLKQIVSSFTRGANNAISIGTIGINASQISLYNATTTGVLDGVSTVAVNSFTSTNVIDVDPAITFDANDTLTFTVAQGGSPVQVTVNQAVINSALGTAAAGKISSGADLVSVMNKALANAQITGVTASINGAGTSLVFTGSTAFTIGSAAVNLNGSTNADLTTANLGVVDGAAAGAAAVTMSVATIAIDNNSTKAQIEAMIKIVSNAADKVVTQASNLGAVASRIELQKSFVDTLMDTIDKGISGLVDADMNEESTKLQALQVKQQLGVQALSIANQSAQNVLSLFRS